MYSSLSMDFIFDSYALQSAEPQNTINLELPLGPLQRALRSALNGSSASLRLTKKDGIPVLSMTITTTAAAPPAQSHRPRFGGGRNPNTRGGDGGEDGRGDDDDDDHDDNEFAFEPLETNLRREREKIITQDIPVRVLHPETVETIMQPKVREPDVHIQLPPLTQLKAISDRFTRLAHAATTSASASSSGPSSGPSISGAGAGVGGMSKPGAATAAATAASPRLELSANMHGELRLRLGVDALLRAESRWRGLENPELDPAQLPCAPEDHPSAAFRAAGPGRWATVRVDGRDWSRVLSVGRLDGSRVIACFAHDHALILYVYVPQYDDAPGGGGGAAGLGGEDSVVTVSSPSSPPSSLPLPSPLHIARRGREGKGRGGKGGTSSPIPVPLALFDS